MDGRLYTLDRRIKTASGEVLPARVLVTDDEHRIVYPTALSHLGIEDATRVWGHCYPSGVRNSSVVEATPGYIAPEQLPVNAREGYLCNGGDLQKQEPFALWNRVYAITIVERGETCLFHLYSERELLNNAQVIGVQSVDLDSMLLRAEVGMKNLWGRK